MKWKVGDFGRFLMEDPRRPRFEVIRGIKGQGVEVWYGGSRATTIIPPDIFRSDCTKVWAWGHIDVYPNWLQPGATLRVASGMKFSQATVSVQTAGGYKYRTDDAHVEVTGQTLLVRQIHHDYASCLVTPSGVFALIPVHDLVRFGFQQVTAWDRISQEEDWMETPYNIDDDDLSDITVE